MKVIRKAFRHDTWSPSEVDFLFALSRLPLEDQQSALRFVHQRDVLSALVGRLLVRHVAISVLNLSSSLLKVQRDNLGRPFLTDYQPRLDFNISHGGEYTVIVATTEGRCGVDVMKVELPRPVHTAPAFIAKMRSVFSPPEFELIVSQDSERAQMSCFYRHWCLKEAYLKAVGCGIRIPLNSVKCTLATSSNPFTWCQSDHDFQGHWAFEEHFLPRDHFAAVAWTNPISPFNFPEKNPFLEVTFSELVNGLENLAEASRDSWLLFTSKPKVPNVRR